MIVVDLTDWLFTLLVALPKKTQTSESCRNFLAMSHHSKTFVCHLHKPPSECAACVTRRYLLFQLSNKMNI